MEKSKVQLLADYKKSNKVRRARIVEKAGFTTESAYLRFLTEPEVAKKPATKVVNIKGKAKLSQVLKKFQPGTKVASDDAITVDPTCIDIVVAFDTTGSMASYIQSVRSHIDTLIKDWFKNVPNLRMKIVAFGDYCDMTSKDNFGIAYQETKLTNDVEALRHFVKVAKNTAGGDEDEFYELVLQKIINETPWRSGKKSILLIADCGPHKVGYSYKGIVQGAKVDWKVEAKRAKEAGIQVDTLSIHGNRYPWYKELSEITGGAYLPFNSSEQTGEMISAVAYARGASKEAFYTASTSASTPEMTAVYKTLSTLRDDE